MKIDCSIGEVVDKITILDIKVDRIENKSKVQDCEKERKVLLDALAEKNLLSPIVEYYRGTLRAVNEDIWDLQEILRKTTDWAEYGQLADKVIKQNDARFRLKRLINEVCIDPDQLNLKEQKSYSSTFYNMKFDKSQTDIKFKVAYIRQLSSLYDQVRVLGSMELAPYLQDNPFVTFSEENEEFEGNVEPVNIETGSAFLSIWFFDGRSN